MSKQSSLNRLNTLLKRSPNQEVWVHVKVPICCCLCFLNLWWNVGKRAIYVWAFDYATLIFQDISFLGGIPENQSELGAAQRSYGACLRQGSPTQWGLLDILCCAQRFGGEPTPPPTLHLPRSQVDEEGDASRVWVNTDTSTSQSNDVWSSEWSPIELCIKLRKLSEINSAEVHIIQVIVCKHLVTNNRFVF